MPPTPPSIGRRVESWTFSTAGRATRAVRYGGDAGPGDRGTHGDAPVLLLAPGASAGQDHPGMVALGQALAGQGLAAITFDFPHTAAGRRRPDPAPVVTQCWRDAIASVRARVAAARLFIGGRSMGGRIATELAASDEDIAASLAGIVCFGYPLRPPYRASPRSLSHFEAIDLPILVVQGTRDSFGGPDDIRHAAPTTAKLTVISVDGADHGLTVRKRAGQTDSDVMAGVAREVRSWIREAAASLSRQ